MKIRFHDKSSPDLETNIASDTNLDFVDPYKDLEIIIVSEGVISTFL